VSKIWLLRPGGKFDCHSGFSYGRMENARKIFTATLHPKVIQIDLREVSAEITLCKTSAPSTARMAF
jgi:hypothetical protein